MHLIEALRTGERRAIIRVSPPAPRRVVLRSATVRCRRNLPPFCSQIPCKSAAREPMMSVEVRTVPAAVVSKLDIEVYEEAVRTSAPASESAPHAPRFRVVTRKPLPPPSLRRANPVRSTLFFAAVPAVCLLAYVLFWTMAIRGGYVRDQLRRDIEDMRIEQ